MYLKCVAFCCYSTSVTFWMLVAQSCSNYFFSQLELFYAASHCQRGQRTHHSAIATHHSLTHCASESADLAAGWLESLVCRPGPVRDHYHYLSTILTSAVFNLLFAPHSNSYPLLIALVSSLQIPNIRLRLYDENWMYLRYSMASLFCSLF